MVQRRQSPHFTFPRQAKQQQQRKGKRSRAAGLTAGQPASQLGADSHGRLLLCLLPFRRLFALRFEGSITDKVFKLRVNVATTRPDLIGRFLSE